MEKKTVRIRHQELKRAEAQLVKAETNLLLAACEEFQEYQDATNDMEIESKHFADCWDELTARQQNELRPEFWGDAAQYIEAPRARRDMTNTQFVEACERWGFTSYYSRGIEVNPNRTIGFVYRHSIDGTVQIDHRESLKRAIEWAGIG